MMYPYLDSGVAIRKEEHGKKTEKSIFSLVEPSSSYNKNDRIKKFKMKLLHNRISKFKSKLYQGYPTRDKSVWPHPLLLLHRGTEITKNNTKQQSTLMT